MLKERIEQRAINPEQEKFGTATQKNAKELLEKVFIPRLLQHNQKPLGFPAVAYAAVMASDQIAKKVISKRKNAYESCLIAKKIAGTLADGIEIPTDSNDKTYGFGSGGGDLMAVFSAILKKDSKKEDKDIEADLLLIDALSKMDRINSESNLTRSKIMEERQGKFLELIGLKTWDEAYNMGDVSSKESTAAEDATEHTLKLNGHTFTWITDGYEMFDSEIDKKDSNNEISDKSQEIIKIKPVDMIDVSADPTQYEDDIFKKYPGYVEYDPKKHDISEIKSRSANIGGGMPAYSMTIVLEK